MNIWFLTICDAVRSSVFVRLLAELLLGHHQVTWRNIWFQTPCILHYLISPTGHVHHLRSQAPQSGLGEPETMEPDQRVQAGNSAA